VNSVSNMTTVTLELDFINTKITNIIDTFKDYVISLIRENPDTDIVTSLLKEYKNPQIGIEDLNKKKRVKNNIPLCERCEAKKASGERCSRRKKGTTVYCGTHVKGIPHGKINDKQSSVKKIEIFNKEINGIIYFIDNFGNVYNHEDIQHNKTNPSILTKYTRDSNGEIDIVI
jgi:hypothetical protein